MVKLRAFLWTLLVTALVLTAAACQPADEPADEMETGEMETEEVMPEPTPAPEIRAMADLQGAPGSNVIGTVTFSEQAGGQVQVVARVEGLTPGEHGFHVHETGACDPPDFSSAGGHFAPADNQHGGLDDPQSHAGDLGNITVGDDGIGTLDVTTGKISLGAGANSVLGKAVVVHAGADDLISQPTGDAGGRVACGIIAMAGDAVEQGTEIEVEPGEGGEDATMDDEPESM